MVGPKQETSEVQPGPGPISEWHNCQVYRILAMLTSNYPNLNLRA